MHRYGCNSAIPFKDVLQVQPANFKRIQITYEKAGTHQLGISTVGVRADNIIASVLM